MKGMSLVNDGQLLGKRSNEEKHEKRQAILSNILYLSLRTILLSDGLNMAH